MKSRFKDDPGTLSHGADGGALIYGSARETADIAAGKASRAKKAGPFLWLSVLGRGILSSLWNGLCSGIKWIFETFRHIFASARKGLALILENDNIRFKIKAVLSIIIGVGLLLFLMNTVSHLFSQKVPQTVSQKIEIKIPKPFTIQVAAYLKEEHAEKYIERLQQKGVSATIKQVDGGGKTWYLVRILEFENKESASQYGQKLKQQKLIDDFFVNNK